MKDKHIEAFKLIFIILLCYSGGVYVGSMGKNKIDLPEEISQVKPTDTLKGYYDSKGVLHIEFNNKRNQKWKNIQ